MTKKPTWQAGGGESSKETDLLILSHHDDGHALAVAWACEEVGKRAKLISTSDFPCHNRGTVAIAKGGGCVRVDTEVYGRLAMKAPVVWRRRTPIPVLPCGVHPEDEAFAISSMHDFLTFTMRPDVMGSRWINGPDEGRRAENKLLQLVLAQECGIPIPDSLISNDPAEIREFFQLHRGGGVIAKPLQFRSWNEGEFVYSSFTNQLDESDLIDSDSLSFAPMIYQTMTPKAFELRVVVMGDTVTAARLNSQEVDDAAIDWRADLGGKMDVLPYQLSNEFERALVTLNRKLGVEFSVMDLAVRPDGEVEFFEVNEMGQFLWLEEACPDIALLSKFLKFVFPTDANGAVDFDDLRYSDFLSSGYGVKHIEFFAGKFEAFL